MSAENNQWGRVTEDGTVYVIEDGNEREVGAFPDGTPDEALAFFVRKFDDLEGQVTLLEQRVRSGANAKDLLRNARALKERVTGACAVGDLASLTARLDALSASLNELDSHQAEEAKASLQEAIAFRTSIVEEIEKLSSGNLENVQWKQMTANIDDLFTRWKDHQVNGPRLPKNEADALWKRFRTARTNLENHRRAFFAQLDQTHKEARQTKQRLITRAQELAPKGVDGIPEYRRLLDEWKQAGRAGRKHEDQLWEQFKAAGDVLYQAKNELMAKESEEHTANLEKKRALLDSAKPILQLKDRQEARKRLTEVQLAWDEIGRVPRDQYRRVEDELREIEQHVRTLEDDHWQKTDPEKQARSQGLQTQLEDAIEKLERERDDARQRGDEKAAKEAEEALEARRVWLNALG